MSHGRGLQAGDDASVRELLPASLASKIVWRINERNEQLERGINRSSNYF